MLPIKFPLVNRDEYLLYFANFVLEKAVFNVLVDSDQDYDAYEELEDDFVLQVNDGKPALELVEEDDDQVKEQPEFANKGVRVFQDTDDLDEEAAALKEYRLRMAALLPTASSVPSHKIQVDLDANFDAFMDAEYADDQIGELEEEIDNEDKIKPSALMDAVDEFIEDKKMWFRDLHQKHGDEEERDIPVLVAKNSEALR